MSDFDSLLSLPGGSDFQDVRTIFERGTQEMDLGSIISIEDFTLNESMGAIEIMDPRMDSGVILAEQKDRPPFEPTRHLLPEELCWVMDRLTACEMTWHNGYALAQTVYTCLFVHHRDAILRTPDTHDDSRPREMLSKVLYSYVCGTLKCCDMAWRELAKGNVRDQGEDWNMEKAEVSLCEAMQVARVVDIMQDAILWLKSYNIDVEYPWKEALLARLELRLALVYLYSTGTMESEEIISWARPLFDRVRTGPQPTISSSSHAALCFDIHVSRQLPTYLPLPAMEPLPMPEVWDGLQGLIEGREELFILGRDSNTLLDWQTASSLRSTGFLLDKHKKTAYLRSLGMSLFHTDSILLDRHPLVWVVDQFFLELAGVPPGMLFQAVEMRHQPQTTQIAEKLERDIVKLVIQYQAAFYHNRGRQRREFSNDILEWHQVYDRANFILEGLVRGGDTTEGSVDMLSRIPLVIQHQRLWLITEVLFCGVEMDLYSREELPFVYWYASCVLSAQFGVVRSILSLLDETHDAPSRQASRYLRSRLIYTSALFAMSVGIAKILIRDSRPIHISLTQQALSFRRRFKWAFDSAYDDLQSDPATPDFDGFQEWKAACLEDDEPAERPVVREYFTRARNEFTSLAGRGSDSIPSRLCAREYVQFVERLIAICDTHISKWHSSPLDPLTLTYVTEPHEWFPRA
ncbi:hypothetical protein SISNIDRAFT_447615 [Sistotremastrum niveocremeum HHB9708]|uniref:Mak10-domain-containing protein n=1 Tax=Sistotremastrum niveocremeum HHB9708 TaxID=1314777 RepID=A0A165ACS5_9AGAM|nr:hypothetical protein SISNIDRAFT_447615 [Sistotremastrum niveocremeum HHB9708]